MSGSLYFIDTNIADYQTLIERLSSSDTYYLIDSNSDGLSQIAAILSNYSGLDAIHILSHGSIGSITLGGTVYNAENIAAYQAQLETIGNALSENGDILLYGCNVAEGSVGQSFIDAIAAHTGADVAASNDLTGSSVLGGDWFLEASSGSIEADTRIFAEGVEDYAGLLTTSSSASYPGHSLGEYRNTSAFAALRADGSVVTWGYPSYGGDSSSVASQLDGTLDVTQIFSTYRAFAALRADGSVVTWGSSTAGGDSSSVAAKLDGTLDVVQIFSTSYAFAALRADGSVVTWGYSTNGGDSSSVTSQIDGTLDVLNLSDISSNIYIHAPTASNTAISLDEDSHAGGTLPVSTDADGDSITYATYSDPSHGTLSIAGNGAYTYTPNTDYHGSDSFSYKVTDTTGAYNTYTVDITVNNINDAPVVSSPVTLPSVAEDSGTITITKEELLAHANDPDGDTLFVVDLVASSGTLVDNGDGTWSLTPPANANGEILLVYGISDGTVSVLTKATQSVTAVNDVPTSLDSTVSTNEDTAKVLSVNNFAFYDVDSTDHLSKVMITTLPSAGTITLDGIAVTLNQEIASSDISAGKLAFTPSPNGNGVDYASLGFKISDGTDYSVSENFITFNVQSIRDDMTINGTSGDDILDGDTIDYGSYDTLNGLGGNDILDGKLGADTMSGGTGDDTYYVDNLGDVVLENVDEGIDTVISTISYTLGQNVEKLSLSGIANLNGTGNELNNSLIGNQGNNTLNGLAGNDTLVGGDGRDSFVFNTALDASTNVDTITDFNVVDDTIKLENAIFTQLSATGVLNADYFKDLATGVQDSNDYILYNSDTGVLSYDADGSGSGAAIQFALIGITTHTDLTNVNFAVI